MKLLIIVLLIVPIVAFSQNKKPKWDFPVKPCTEEWKKLENNKAKVDACQLPEILLKKTSTDDLLEICLQYPLIYNLFAFNNKTDGINRLFNDFNGIRELFKRKDIHLCLLKKYASMVQNFSSLEQGISKLEKGYFILSVSTFEVLLSYHALQNNINNDGMKEILQSLTSGYVKKCKYADYFKGPGFQTNFYSRAQVIKKMDVKSLEKLPGKTKNPVLFSGMADSETIKVINDLSIAQVSLDPNVLQVFSQMQCENCTICGMLDPEYIDTNVKTPNGCAVSAWVMTDAITDCRECLDRYWHCLYPTAEMINLVSGEPSSSDLYNCHGYAWLKTETEPGVKRWIGIEDSTQEDVYMTDGSYRLVGGPTDGGKVSWVSYDHSAVTTAESGVVISKWGNGPLMKHALNDCPYYDVNNNNNNNNDVIYYERNNISEDITIVGPSPSFVCYTNPTIFTIHNPHDIQIKSINWGCTDNLEIVSGGNSTTCNIRRKGVGTGFVTAEVTIGPDGCSIFQLKHHDIPATTPPDDSYISGPSLVCPYSESTFTVNNPHAGTITWQYDTNLLAMTSAQGSNPCNFVSVGSGNAWVRAVINDDCGGQFTTSQVNCSAGAPTLMYLDGPTWVQEDHGDTYYAEKDVWNLGAQYYWYVSPSGYVSSPTNDNGAYVTFGGPGTYTLQVAACNSCGCSDNYYLEIEVYHYYRLMFSPNPSTSQTTVSLQSTSGEITDNDPEWYLEVYNQGLQQKIFAKNIKGKEFNLNTSNWSDGLYIIHARYQGKWLTGKLVVGKN